MSGAADGEATARCGLRLDKWLWHARFIRHRELAAELVAGRRVRLNEQLVTKTHQLVRPGDTMLIDVEMTKSRGKIGKAKGEWLVKNSKPGKVAMLLGPAGALVRPAHWATSTVCVVAE